MTIHVGGEIRRVAVIDDKEAVRKSFAFSVQDLDLTPVLQSGPLEELDACVARLARDAEAALCDFQLRVSMYAPFDGAELVAALYKARMPAVLCTKFVKSNIDEIRRYRHAIPTLLMPDELNDESLMSGFDTCVREFRQEFAPQRRSWRALVRFQSVSEHYAHIVVPSWNANEGLRLLRSSLPKWLDSKATPEFRCHAQVNLGAERQEDLFFVDWEE